MNYKNAILFAAILFVAIFVVSPAMAENTYGQVNLHPEINYAQQGSPGFVIFYERGVSVQDHNIIVTNDIDPSVNETITINPDGNSGLMQFAAGNYTAYLKQGNGDQPEIQHFKAGGGVTTGVTFLGAAIPGSQTVNNVPLIVKSAYGYSDSFVRHVTNSTSDPSELQGVSNVVKFTVITKVGTPGTPAYYTVVDAEHHQIGNCEEYNGNGNYDFKIGNQKYRFDKIGDDIYTYHPAVQGTPNVSHPEWNYDILVIDGTVIDVTAQLQQVVNSGHLSFVFRNDYNPGGIFNADSTVLFAPITDPAYGFVKNVHIEFVGGYTYSVQTIDAHEYDVITLPA